MDGGTEYIWSIWMCLTMQTNGSFNHQTIAMNFKAEQDSLLDKKMVQLRLSQLIEKLFPFNFMFKLSHYVVMLTGTSL